MIERSDNHKMLLKQGYTYEGSSVGGWTHHYKHPETGRKVKIEFSHSNDTHGTVVRERGTKSQHSEEEMTPEHAEELVAASPFWPRRGNVFGFEAVKNTT